MKIEIEIETEQADFLVVESLKRDLDGLRVDQKAREENRGIPVWYLDKDEDLVAIAHMIGSFKTVLEYYGHNDEHNGVS